MFLRTLRACAFAAPLLGVIPAQSFARVERSYLTTRGAESADAIFLKQELQKNAYELVAALLARHRTTRHDIRLYSERLIHDHSIHNAALLRLMSAKKVELPTALRRADHERMQKLAQLNGKRFDQAFLREAKRLNSSDMRLLREQGSRTADRDIRDWIHFFLKIDAVHEQMARSLLQASVTEYKMRIIRPPENGYRMPIVRPWGVTQTCLSSDLRVAESHWQSAGARPSSEARQTTPTHLMPRFGS